MQDNYTTKGKHLTIDSRRLYAVEFFRTPKFIHFLREHHRVLKKD
ncbi:transposase-like protein%2C IS1239 [Streptococcus pneumoniae]|nr:transposase-like protein%2C IS1239 [Streptococcus pneumoniae]